MLEQDKWPVIPAGFPPAREQLGPVREHPTVTGRETSTKHKNCYFRSLPREETAKLQVTAGLIEEHIPCGVFKI